MEIKPIETVYNGYRFRSRLEARWAVFFDCLEIEYEYEPQGFELQDGTRYLPDFWFPHSISSLAAEGQGMWAEMKPRQINNEAMRKALYLARGSTHNFLIFQGLPWYRSYTVTKISVQGDEPPLITDGLCFVDAGLAHSTLIHLENKAGFSSHPSAYFNGFKEIDVLHWAYCEAKGARFEHGERP